MFYRKGKTIKGLDFQNDVAVSDIQLAIKEGYRSIEHVKRYTTLGMATDQVEQVILMDCSLFLRLKIKLYHK